MGDARRWFPVGSSARRWILSAAALLLLARPCPAQIGPGELDLDAGDAPSIGEESDPFVDDPDAGDAPSIGEESNQFMDDPDAGDAPSIGERSNQFMDDPDAGDAPSIGEESNQFMDDPDAGDAPSIGEEPIPGEGPPYGRLEPFGGE